MPGSPQDLGCRGDGLPKRSEINHDDTPGAIGLALFIPLGSSPDVIEGKLEDRSAVLMLSPFPATKLVNDK